ncbi:MAG TPA: helix-turn-helix transcriptional regulator [Gaiellales bacterium]|nr:helix-turn-helix transcriptional regulator [Gaiellales bacterium]
MLGDLIRRERERLGISMREAARRIGISPAYLVELEHGLNPTTGRPPTPSPAVLAGIERALGVDITTLLRLTAGASPPSAHMLLVQAGRRRSARVAAARAFGDGIDAWIDAGPLATLASLSAPPGRRLGLVFGSRSATLDIAADPAAVLAAERTWEDDVAAACRDAGGGAPAANVCVYRERDLRAAPGDPVAVAIDLIRSHPHVAAQDASGRVTTGPPAIEVILAAVRPAGVSDAAWAALSAAAALGLHREAA